MEMNARIEMRIFLFSLYMCEFIEILIESNNLEFDRGWKLEFVHLTIKLLNFSCFLFLQEKGQIWMIQRSLLTIWRAPLSLWFFYGGKIDFVQVWNYPWGKMVFSEKINFQNNNPLNQRPQFFFSRKLC